ncbi:MAG TPA: enoyl-CoA hydratase/isomerase family protein [Bryobacteraceae bacterium]
MIKVGRSGAVLHLTLNRPGKRNAISGAMVSELTAAFQESAQDEDLRVVLIRGEGPDFCAGMDIAELSETADAGVAEHRESASNLAELYRAMRRHPRPVVAAVRGRALGGGCGLAMASDVVIASERAQFGFPEVKIGFVPAIVMSLLRRSVGEKRAFDLLTSGDSLGAREAFEIGMITRVCADAEFDTAVEAYASRLAETSATAVGMTKKLLYSIDGMSFDAAMDAGVQMNALARMTDDARRGFERFGKK